MKLLCCEARKDDIDSVTLIKNRMETLAWELGHLQLGSSSLGNSLGNFDILMAGRCCTGESAEAMDSIRAGGSWVACLVWQVFEEAE